MMFFWSELIEIDLQKISINFKTRNYIETKKKPYSIKLGRGHTVDILFQMLDSDFWNFFLILNESHVKWTTHLLKNFSKICGWITVIDGWKGESGTGARIVIRNFVRYANSREIDQEVIKTFDRMTFNQSQVSF